MCRVSTEPSRSRSVAKLLGFCLIGGLLVAGMAFPFAAGFGVAFMLQSVPAMVEQLPNMQPAWSVTMVGALVASLALTVVVSVIDRGLRIGHVTFAVVYLIALISWPFAVIDPAQAPSSSYWLYYTLTIATAMATVGLGIRLATAYVVLAPVIYGIIRITPPGGEVTITQTVLDSVYAIILGGAITIITAILRNAASSVDRAQATALQRYGHAVRQHATEAERVQVDAIVHDAHRGARRRGREADRSGAVRRPPADRAVLAGR